MGVCDRLCLLRTLLCAAVLCYSYAPYAHTKELQSKYLSYFSSSEDSTEKQLISDLQGVLERLKNNRFPPQGKKQSYLPMCDPGEQCALRKGSRIGKLCDCASPRTCNSFLHRCL